ncbi:alpha/beta hydrolase [Streptomyces sp. NPDC096310]|uniref:alpha/beta hydrolase n=1 Tax=Streptomyces sp. NPDC096310 TaxID=3366082 RepID=UPI0038136C0F
MSVTPPPFDPELAVVLELNPESTTVLTPELILLAREIMAQQRPTDEEIRRQGTFTFEEREVPGPAGAPAVSLLICRPAGAPRPSSARLPALYCVHGGGMVSGDNRLGILDRLDLAHELGGLVVVSVEYRLAPEHPHPAPVEDCYAGLVWTARHARELGIDRDRIFVVGSSAGGGLAAALALMARDRGGPEPAGQFLMAPMLDDRNNSPSSHQMAGVGTWDRASNHTGWSALLGDRMGKPGVSPYAAPARATDLSGLPPLYIEVGSAETFRSENVDYASRIWMAGGRAELHVWPGGFHGFHGDAPKTRITRDVKEARLRWMRRVLATL